MQVRLFIFCTFCSLKVSAIFDHFGYPSPHLDQWQQHTWYDLGATQDLLHHMCNRLAKGLPATASPLRTGPPSSSYMPTSMATHPTFGGKFTKASKERCPPQSVTTVGPPPAVKVTTSKTEVRKRRKNKQETPRCTVTSETIPAAKKTKVVSESPDSEAEGPFRDSDRTISMLENSPNTSQ